MLPRKRLQAGKCDPETTYIKSEAEYEKDRKSKKHKKGDGSDCNSSDIIQLGYDATLSRCRGE